MSEISKQEKIARKLLNMNLTVKAGVTLRQSITVLLSVLNEDELPILADYECQNVAVGFPYMFTTIRDVFPSPRNITINFTGSVTDKGFEQRVLDAIQKAAEEDPISLTAADRKVEDTVCQSMKADINRWFHSFEIPKKKDKYPPLDVSDAADAKRFRWLLDGNGYFMEENGLCGHGPCDVTECNTARRKIDEAMRDE